ncbi:hypothetical protein CHS0354_005320, partial [Potamilus streckersoni]
MNETVVRLERCLVHMDPELGSTSQSFGEGNSHVDRLSPRKPLKQTIYLREQPIRIQHN